MSDLITLPREVVQEALEALEYMNVTAEHCVDNKIPDSAITALRTHLAAPRPEPEPGLMELAQQMKPLDADMVAILHANLDSLYIEYELTAAPEQEDEDDIEECWVASLPQGQGMMRAEIEALRREAEQSQKQKERSYRLQRLLKECVKVMQANAVFRDTKVHKDLKTRIRVELEDKT